MGNRAATGFWVEHAATHRYLSFKNRTDAKVVDGMLHLSPISVAHNLSFKGGEALTREWGRGGRPWLLQRQGGAGPVIPCCRKHSRTGELSLRDSGTTNTIQSHADFRRITLKGDFAPLLMLYRTLSINNVPNIL